MRWLYIIGLMLGLAGVSNGAMLYLEDFDDPTPNGWGDRDAGEMTVTHDTGNDWMQGSFSSSLLPMTDAFRISTGSNFLGDYITPGLTKISFDLKAVSVLPSDLFIRIIDGANVFSYQFTPINLGNFQTYVVDLSWSFGWVGLSEAAFSNALASVDAVEIQITRNGSGAQNYYLDNVQTLDTIDDPMVSVPEPGTLSLFAMVAGMILILRRRVNFGTMDAA